MAEGNYRPAISHSLTPRVKELIKECWAPDDKSRPSFDRVCLSLKKEHEELSKEQGCVDPGGISRSMRLVDQTSRSIRMHVKRHGSMENSAHGQCEN